MMALKGYRPFQRRREATLIRWWDELTIYELQRTCELAKQSTGKVRLLIQHNPTNKGIRMLPKEGPFGEVICVNSSGHTVGSFDADDILNWLKKRGW